MNIHFYFLVEGVYFTASLKELKEGWCYKTKYLTKITISPFNGQFVFKNDKYLLGKSNPNNDEFDVLLFASRDIEEISIPSNIIIISSFAFSGCKNLTKVEILTNSNLQIIKSNAFEKSNIEKNYIPSESNICSCKERFITLFNISTICRPTRYINTCK